MTLLTRQPAVAESDDVSRPGRLRRWWQGRERRSNAERLWYLVLAIAVALPVLTSQMGYYTPDIKIEVYLNPWHRLALDLSTWLPDPQGGIGNYNLGLAPVDFAIAVLRSAGATAEVAVRLTKLGLVLFGAWGAVRFLRDVTGDKTTAPMRVAMAVFFVANPYTIVSGNQLAIQLPMSLLPWFLIAVGRSVRCGGWRWPAVAALASFAMTGMNTGAVQVLQAACVPALVVWTARTWSVPWRQVLAAIGRVVLAIGLVSVYWLIPSLMALGTAISVVNNTESIETISSVSSFSEVLRGLGMWTMYGSSAVTGPWQPGFISYLTNPFVILASFAFPVIAFLGLMVNRTRVAVLGFALAASAAVVMVGQHPVADRTPFGRLLDLMFTEVPATAAWRTTNKAGSGLALGFALLCALAVAWLAPKLTGLGPRSLALGLGVVLVALMAQPATVGQMYLERWQIPSYWDSVGPRLDDGPSTDRAWWVPGQVLARYRWSTDSYDDLPLSLLDTRPSMLRTTLPTDSAALSNFLAASDIALQEGSSLPSSVSAAARYLGVGTVFLRNDVDWQAFDGGRPFVIQRQLDSDPGLISGAHLGRPGENVRPPGPAQTDDVYKYEADATPLHFYGVGDPGSVVRAEPADALVTVDGDGFAFNNVEQFGFLEEGRPFRYAGDLPGGELGAVLGGGHVVVFTDTNARRNINQGRLLNALGPVLPADATLNQSRTLFGDDTATQSVLVWEGAKNVTVSVPPDLATQDQDPAAVFDSNPGTRWRIGDGFTDVRGSALAVDLLGPTPIHEVQIQAPDGVGSLEYAVSAGGATRKVRVDPGGTATADMRGVSADSVTITVSDVVGADAGLTPPVVISDIAIDAVPIRPVVRTPTAFVKNLTSAPESIRWALDDTVLSVVLARDVAGPFVEDDREANLNRDVAFPVDRSLSAVGLVRSTAPPTGSDCVEIATVNDAPLMVRRADPTGAPPAVGLPWLYRSCSDTPLIQGTNKIRAVEGSTVDVLSFMDPRLLGRSAAPAAAASSVVTHSTTETEAHFEPAATDQYAVFSQNWNSHWRATVDGTPAVPLVLDGQAAAFPISAGAAHDVRIWYQPQGSALISRAVSVVALVVCTALWLVPGFRRRSRLGGSDWRAPEVPARHMLSGMTPALARVVVGVAVTVTTWFFAGPVVAAVSGVVALIALIWEVRDVRLIAVGAAVLAAVPFVWMFAIADSWGLISAALISEAEFPSQMAAVALSTVLLGVCVRYLPAGRRPVGGGGGGGAASGPGATGGDLRATSEDGE